MVKYLLNQFYLLLLSLFGFVFLYLNINQAFNNGLVYTYDEYNRIISVTWSYFGFQSFPMMIQHFLDEPSMNYFLDVSNLLQWLSIFTDIPNDFLRNFVIFLAWPYYIVAPIVYLISLIGTIAFNFANTIILAADGYFNVSHTMFTPNGLPPLIHNNINVCLSPFSFPLGL